jgi:hypothetical protein
MNDVTGEPSIVITLRIRDAADAAFFSWQARMSAAAAAATGFYQHRADTGIALVSGMADGFAISRRRVLGRMALFSQPQLPPRRSDIPAR